MRRSLCGPQGHLNSTVQLVVILLVPDLSSPAKLSSDPFIPPQALPPSSTESREPLTRLPGLRLPPDRSCSPDFQNRLIYPRQVLPNWPLPLPTTPIWKGGLGQPGAARDAHTPGPAAWHPAVSQQAYKSTNTAGLEPDPGLRGVEGNSQSLWLPLSQALPSCRSLPHPQSEHRRWGTSCPPDPSSRSPLASCPPGSAAARAQQAGAGVEKWLEVGEGS